MYIAYFWFPFHFERRCRWYFQQAAIQMLLHSITYQSFLLMLIFSSIFKSYGTLLVDEYPQIALYYQRLLEMDKQSLFCKRTIITPLEALLLLWMLGYVQRNISTVICTRRRLELMDLSTTILFTLYVLLFTVAAIQSHLEWKFILDTNRWKHFEHLHNGMLYQSFLGVTKLLFFFVFQQVNYPMNIDKSNLGMKTVLSYTKTTTNISNETI